MKRFALICLFLLPAVWAFAQNNPVPFLSQPLTPTSVVPGHGAFSLKVTGAGFRAGAVVNWNGSPRATTLVSRDEVDAAISATDVAHQMVAAITVSNPAPGGGVSNLEYFPVGPVFGGLAFARRDTVVRPSIRSPQAQPIDPVVADFNHDGNLDLAVGWSDGIIQIFLGNGDGTFQRPLETDVHFPISALVTGDFNGDGNEDIALAYADPFGPSLYVFLGTGDGHFTEAPDGGSMGYQPDLAADFNGDGKLDLIVAHFDSENDAFLYLALGNGDGTFANPVFFEEQEFYSLPAAGDFNSDGILDIATTPCLYCSKVFPGEVDVFRGTTAGFQPPISFAMPNRGQGVAVGDVNRDGSLDIVAAYSNILLGNGTGGFTEQGDGANVGGSQLVDFNNDQKLDMFLPVPGGFSIFLGNGDGTFQPQQSWSSGTAGTNAIVVGIPKDGSLAVIDLNTDRLGQWVISVYRQTAVSVPATAGH